MAQGSSTHTNQISGTGGGYFRDVNASLGALDFGSSSATSKSGDIRLGDVMSGSAGRIGLVKTLFLFGGAYLLIRAWSKK